MLNIERPRALQNTITFFLDTPMYYFKLNLFLPPYVHMIKGYFNLHLKRLIGERLIHPMV